MLKRKRTINQYNELSPDAVSQIEQQLQLLEKSTAETIVDNIKTFLSFINTPNIKRFLSPKYSDKLIHIFNKHNQLLVEMGIIDWPIRLVHMLSPLPELEGLYNTVLGDECLEADSNQSLDYFFTGLANGSSLAAIHLVYYHLSLLGKKEPAMSLPEYEILITNLLYPLKTPGYILAGQFYYTLCFYLHETTADPLTISHYMSLAIQALLIAEALLPTSTDHIYNAYGEDFETALEGDLVFLNEKRFFSSISDYCKYIQQQFSQATGLNIDFNKIRRDLATSQRPDAFCLNSIYSLFVETNPKNFKIGTSSSSKGPEQPDDSSAISPNKNRP